MTKDGVAYKSPQQGASTTVYATTRCSPIVVARTSRIAE
jgi:hypothetical protein